MKLFEITYVDYYDEYNTYLTVGDDELKVKEREKKSLKNDQWGYYDFSGIEEVNEVNGYKIIVGDKIDEKNKEQIYDEQIYPLMDKIIKICQENDIQMIASYCLSVEDEGLMCTTYLNSQEENCDVIKDANKVIQGGWTVNRPFMIEYTSTKN